MIPSGNWDSDHFGSWLPLNLSEISIFLTDSMAEGLRHHLYPSPFQTGSFLQKELSLSPVESGRLPVLYLEFSVLMAVGKFDIRSLSFVLGV